MIARGGKCYIGKNFIMNNGVKGNPIGCYQKCTIFVDREGELVIGDNVGISQTALICTKKNHDRKLCKNWRRCLHI